MNKRIKKKKKLKAAIELYGVSFPNNVIPLVLTPSQIKELKADSNWVIVPSWERYTKLAGQANSIVSAAIDKLFAKSKSINPIKD